MIDSLLLWSRRYHQVDYFEIDKSDPDMQG